jgi:hypothetical protein
MREIPKTHPNIVLPLKSVAGALLFSVVLGPVGLLYASTLGGALMTFLLVTVVTNLGFVVTIVPAVLNLWLISCVWSVIAVNRYNKKMARNMALFPQHLAAE